MSTSDNTESGLLESGPDGGIIYSVLSASFRMKPLLPEHEEALEHVLGIVDEWYGEKLRWTTGSVVGPTREYEREDLEFISTYPGSLPVGTVTTEQEFWERKLKLTTLTDFAVRFHGAAQPSVGSPFSLCFYSVIHEVSRDGTFRTSSALNLTVPETTPIDEFEGRVRDIAAALPVTWGIGGYGFSSSSRSHHDRYRRAAFAQARRHPGFDVGFDWLLHPALEDRIRSVNWLTFLGSDLAKAVDSTQLSSSVEVDSDGPIWVAKAGRQPERGDHNRRDYPKEYKEVDRALRSIRATGEIDFGEPFDKTTSTEWIERFQRARY